MPAEVSQVIAWGMDLPAYRGKVYHLCDPDQVMKAKYESWLKQSAMEECIEASAGLSDKEKEANRRIVLSDLALKKYKWGGDLWSQSLQTSHGMAKLISIMLRDNKKREVNEDIVLDMLNEDNPIAPWLLGAVYIVCGMDPTMALAAGRMTFAEASKNKAESQELVNQIMKIEPGTLSVTTPNSGQVTQG